MTADLLLAAESSSPSRHHHQTRREAFGLLLVLAVSIFSVFVSNVDIRQYYPHHTPSAASSANSIVAFEQSSIEIPQLTARSIKNVISDDVLVASDLNKDMMEPTSLFHNATDETTKTPTKSRTTESGQHDETTEFLNTTSPSSDVSNKPLPSSSLAKEATPLFPPNGTHSGTAVTTTINSTTSTTHSIEQGERYLHPDFRICKATIESGYYCEGNAYDEFARKMEQLIIKLTTTNSNSSGHEDKDSNKNNQTKTTKKAPLWGRRPHPIPKPNQTVLFFGNSHMRQIFGDLVCQYTDQVVQDYTNNGGKMANIRIVTFPQNRTLVSVTNHYLAYSKIWDTLLEYETGYPLEAFDALVIGKCNYKKNSKKTNFEAWMKNVTANMPHVSYDSQPPPDVLSILDRLQHDPTTNDTANTITPRTPRPIPIVWTSTFSKVSRLEFGGDSKRAHAWLLQHNQSTDRVPIVDARAYIRELGECGAPTFYYNAHGPLSCAGGTHLHRCVGKKGGHPTLAAWDVVEALHGVLK
jgi:hypothetical protein